jgi:hypothetical protein
MEGQTFDGDLDAFIHETLHAMFWAYSLFHDPARGVETEEEVVRRLPQMLMQFYVDNPKAVAWLGQQFQLAEAQSKA